MKTRVIVGCLLLMLFSASQGLAQVVEMKDGVERLAVELAKSVPEARVLRVAVTDFPDLEGVTSNLGRYTAERLTTRLSAQSAKFRVIERRRLGQVLDELKFNTSDLIDPSKAKQLGRMLGVDVIVVGTLSDLGNSVEIDARMIEIETSSVLPGVSIAVAKDETVKQMMAGGRTTAPETQRGRPPSTPHPGGSGGKPITFEGKHFRMDLISAEVVGSTVRLTVLLSNLSERQAHFAVSALGGVNSNYMIDALGNRYKLAGGSALLKGVSVPPGVAVRHWLAFELPEVQTSQLHVFVTVASSPLHPGQLATFRNIPWPR